MLFEIIVMLLAMQRKLLQEGFSDAFMLGNYPPLDMDGLANLGSRGILPPSHLPGQNKTVACSDEL